MRYATFRLVLVGLMVMGAACGSSPTTFAPPTSPSPAATPAFQHLDGVWRGFLKLTASTEYDVGTTLPFTLRISGGPQSYAGQFELQGGRVNVGISGTLREDGFAVLSGSTTTPTFLSTAAHVSELIVKSDDTTGLVGTVQFGWGSGRFTERLSAQILSASLQQSSAYPGGPIEGRWIGETVIRSCSGLCSSLYRPGGIREIELVLRQSGSTLTGLGEFGSGGCNGDGCWVPLSGSANGPAITSLTGHLTHELLRDQSGDRVITISDFSATVDDLGRMHARYVYSSENRQWLPSNPVLQDGTSRLEMESVWLRREP
jgi:hypothetical protein